MKHSNLIVICLIAASVASAADLREIGTNSWHPNTKLLDANARHSDPITLDAGSTLAHDVKRYYQLLRDKQWPDTYDLRAKAFREDVSKSDYLEKAKSSEKLWSLVNYDVLSILFRSSYGSTDVDEAILICKFTELPGYEQSYSTVFWHKEDGVWKCLSAGPHKLAIFEGTRIPTIDWK